MAIKVETKLDEEKGIAMLAFEASKEADYENLDLICAILSNCPDSKVAFIRGNRLVGHFKGVISASTDSSTDI